MLEAVRLLCVLHFSMGEATQMAVRDTISPILEHPGLLIPYHQVKLSVDVDSGSHSLK